MVHTQMFACGGMDRTWHVPWEERGWEREGERESKANAWSWMSIQKVFSFEPGSASKCVKKQWNIPVLMPLVQHSRTLKKEKKKRRRQNFILTLPVVYKCSEENAAIVYTQMTTQEGVFMTCTLIPPVTYSCSKKDKAVVHTQMTPLAGGHGLYTTCTLPPPVLCTCRCSEGDRKIWTFRSSLLTAWCCTKNSARTRTRWPSRHKTESSGSVSATNSPSWQTRWVAGESDANF